MGHLHKEAGPGVGIPTTSLWAAGFRGGSPDCSAVFLTCSVPRSHVGAIFLSYLLVLGLPGCLGLR